MKIKIIKKHSNDTRYNIGDIFEIVSINHNEDVYIDTKDNNQIVLLKEEYEFYNE